MNDGGYIKSLDGVRAIAILLVMTFHTEVTHFGWIGVQLFFVLSGFLITGILWKEKFKTDALPYKFKKFWVRRALRIFPLYFGYLSFFGLAYLIFHFPVYYHTYFPYLATYTFNYTRSLPAWQGNPLFTHLWSLSVEEQFYLFFPLILFFSSPRFLKFFMVAIIIIAPITRFILGEYYKHKGFPSEVVADIVYWNTLSHLDAFFIGGIIPVLSLHTRIKKPHLLFGGTFIIVLLAGIWNFTHSPSGNYYFNDLGYNHGLTHNYEHVWHYTLLNVLFAAFLLTLVSPHSRQKLTALRKVLESKLMVRIGKVSYGMYIIHWGILVYFYERIFPAHSITSKILLFIPYFILVYLLAEVSYNLYELRFIKLKDILFRPKPAEEPLLKPSATTTMLPLLKETPDGSF